MCGSWVGSVHREVRGRNDIHDARAHPRGSAIAIAIHTRGRHRSDVKVEGQERDPPVQRGERRNGTPPTRRKQ